MFFAQLMIVSLHILAETNMRFWKNGEKISERIIVDLSITVAMGNLMLAMLRSRCSKLVSFDEMLLWPRIIRIMLNSFRRYRLDEVVCFDVKLLWPRKIRIF
jgi:hypothetical protein